MVLLVTSLLYFCPAKSADDGSLAGSVSDSLAEAQEKLLHAKGSYKTIKMQEEAIESMRKATSLSLRAAKLRAKAEKMQHKADVLVNKANLAALSRGLYVTNPLAPVMMEPPPTVSVQPATSPVTPPVPGEPISISIPKEQEVTYRKEDPSDGILPDDPATINNY